MALLDDDLEPIRTTPSEKDLDRMSIDELQEYIADMEREISRVKEMIAGRKDHRSSAESVFRK